VWPLWYVLCCGLWRVKWARSPDYHRTMVIIQSVCVCVFSRLSTCDLWQLSLEYVEAMPEAEDDGVVIVL